MVNSIHDLDINKHYTYGDYVLWQFKERVELLRGRLLPMAAPNVKHQKISSNLHIVIGNFLLDKPCLIFSAPFDVRLPLPKGKMMGNKADTVVQPDLCIICDETKLDENGCVGAPELIVEILSPSNSKREMKEKFELYQEAGVLEYWIVDPEHRIVFVYLLSADTGKFAAVAPAYTDEDVLPSAVLKGLAIHLDAVFV